MRRFDQTVRQLFSGPSSELLHTLTGERFQQLKPLSTKLQIVLEREPDFLREAIQPGGGKALIHVEVQSSNDREMAYRMQEYYAVVRRKYQVPVWQYVVYIGKAPLNMDSVLQDRQNHFAFRLVDVAKIPSAQFLASGNPDLFPWAVLGDFEGRAAEQVIQRAARGITKAESAPKKLTNIRLNALSTFSVLRKLEEQTIKIIQDMPIQIDEETILNSPLTKYIMGLVKDRMVREMRDEVRKEVREEVAEEAKVQTAIRLLEWGRMNLNELQQIADLPLPKLQEIRARIGH